jgi:hypothetical protein
MRRGHQCASTYLNSYVFRPATAALTAFIIAIRPYALTASTKLRFAS